MVRLCWLQETYQLFQSEGGGAMYERSGNDLEVLTSIKGCERRGLAQRTMRREEGWAKMLKVA